MKNLVLSAFADEYDGDFEKQLKALNNFGIDYLEIRFVDGKNVSALNVAEVARVKSLLKQYGIKISSIGSPIGKIALDGDLKAHFEMAKNVFTIAKTLGARYVRIFSFYPPEGKQIADCRDAVLAELEKLMQLAHFYDVTLCHENEGGIYGESPTACLELLSSFDNRMKAVFDMGNFTAGGYDPLQAYGLLKSHIAYFHIKDATKEGREIVPPGGGDACIREILSDYNAHVASPTFATIEPHLQAFAGLSTLTSAELNTPYRYDTPQAAFSDAVTRIKEILQC